MRKKVPVPGKKTLVPDSASSEGRAIRQVEILSNKLLTTAFEASLESAAVTLQVKRRQQDNYRKIRRSLIRNA